MHDTHDAVVDVKVASQDSSGSGATIGSLEVTCVSLLLCHLPSLIW